MIDDIVVLIQILRAVKQLLAALFVFLGIVAPRERASQGIRRHNRALTPNQHFGRGTNKPVTCVFVLGRGEVREKTVQIRSVVDKPRGQQPRVDRVIEEQINIASNNNLIDAGPRDRSRDGVDNLRVLVEARVFSDDVRVGAFAPVEGGRLQRARVSPHRSGARERSRA